MWCCHTAVHCTFFGYLSCVDCSHWREGDYDSPRKSLLGTCDSFVRFANDQQSGLCACAINISQFFIVNGAGPVASTVVGHMKTCSIVALGWMVSGRPVDDKSVLGILMASSGIVAYVDTGIERSSPRFAIGMKNADIVL